MDKRKAIAAYKQGLITAQQCAQILGIDKLEWLNHVPDLEPASPPARKQQPVRT